ncbi:MAG: hypothetical protein ACLRLD_06265 [Lachnospira sp.]|jgi:hypothetical protein
MKYPCVILKQFCKTDIEVTLDREGRDKYGSQLEPVKWSGKSNYQDSARTVLTAQKELIQLSGAALIPGDIAPGLSVISGGTIKVCGVERKIYKGNKVRNPDGSVNYTRLDVR